MSDYSPDFHKSSRVRQTTDAAFSESLRQQAGTKDDRLSQDMLRLAERMKIPELTFKARYAAGVCVGCGQTPCSSCGKEPALWCDICWHELKRCAPEGMVVSGLQQIMQLITRNGERPT